MKKNNLNLTSVLLLFLLGFLLLSIDSTSFTTPAEVSKNNYAENPALQALTLHGPIYIDYDDNFTDYGFLGIGTEGDPYRIENYNITVSGDYPILFSGNNTKHFVIQNCFLKSDTNIGIYLGKYYDMGEGTVNILDNIIIAETQSGIEMNGGNYSVISGNTIMGFNYGIYIQYGVYSFVSENNITGSDDCGISLEYCDNSTISRNTCVGNYFGIYTYQCSNSLVNHNNVTHNEEGISVEGNNINIINNIIVNNDGDGIWIDNCYDSVFTNNLLQENTFYGINLNLNSENNILHHNAFIDNNLIGTSQANDDGANNIWYDSLINEGNYWNDWTSGSYSIDGTALAVDPYPLSSMPVIPEYSSSHLAILIILGFLVLPVINFVSRKKKI